jgi:hypothetical protein
MRSSNLIDFTSASRKYSGEKIAMIYVASSPVFCRHVQITDWAAFKFNYEGNI